MLAVGVLEITTIFKRDSDNQIFLNGHVLLQWKLSWLVWDFEMEPWKDSCCSRREASDPSVEVVDQDRRHSTSLRAGSFFWWGVGMGGGGGKGEGKLKRGKTVGGREREKWACPEAIVFSARDQPPNWPASQLSNVNQSARTGNKRPNLWCWRFVCFHSATKRKFSTWGKINPYQTLFH